MKIPAPFRRRRSSLPRFRPVAPWLLIGPALHADAYRNLVHEHGVTHIVDLREEDTDDPDVMEALRVRWIRVPIPDSQAPEPSQLDDVERWIEPCLRGSGVAYLHCQGGLGRAPTVAIALLMRRGFSLAEAYRIVRMARTEGMPTEQQHGWLERLVDELAQRGAGERAE
jgi:protein-tyrosine phosphatase